MADMKQKGMGLLCPECKSMSARLMLNRKTNQRECKKPGCGYFELNSESLALIRERKNKQMQCKRYCRCAKCFATKDEPDSISFWSY